MGTTASASAAGSQSAYKYDANIGSVHQVDQMGGWVGIPWDEFGRSEQARMTQKDHDLLVFERKYDLDAPHQMFPRPTGLAMIIDNDDRQPDEDSDREVEIGHYVYIGGALAVTTFLYYKCLRHDFTNELVENYAEVVRKERIFHKSIGIRYEDIE
jgi:hypothetical protein